MNNALRWGTLTGLFAVLLVPLVVTEQLFFPFITGKGFAFRIIVEIIFALWLILALRDPSARTKQFPLSDITLGCYPSAFFNSGISEVMVFHTIARSTSK